MHEHLHVIYRVTYHISNRVSPKCELDALLGVQKSSINYFRIRNFKMHQHCKGLLKKQYAYFPYFTNDFGETGYKRSHIMLVGNSEFREYRGNNSHNLLSCENKSLFYFIKFSSKLGGGGKSETHFPQNSLGAHFVKLGVVTAILYLQT